MSNIPSNAKPLPSWQANYSINEEQDDWGHTALGVGPALQPLLIVPIASLEHHKE